MTKPDENIPFYKTVLLASAAGAAGGFVGTPADMINVRMQNDVKLPLEKRRKYEYDEILTFYLLSIHIILTALVCMYLLVKIYMKHLRLNHLICALYQLL